MNVPHHQMVASSSELTVGDLQSHPLNKLRLSHDDEFYDKSTTSIKSRGESTLKSWNAETELMLEDASLVVIDDMVGGGSSDSHHHHHHQQHHNKTGDGSSHNESERATSEPSEGEHEKEGENDSIAYTSMEKEFRKLIQENKDLLNTKNALNVVKDDLIAEVDRLTNEVSMYEQAVEQLNSTKDQMKQKVSVLDAELRKTKEELEKAKQKIREVSCNQMLNNTYDKDSYIDQNLSSNTTLPLSRCRTTKRACPIRKENASAERKWQKCLWNETIIRRDLWNYKTRSDTLNSSVRIGLKRKNDLVYGNC